MVEQKQIPEAKFELENEIDTKDMEVRDYCNVHGL